MIVGAKMEKIRIKLYRHKTQINQIYEANKVKGEQNDRICDNRRTGAAHDGSDK